MSDNVVARLRGELAAVARMNVAPGYTELGVDVREIAALLDVVEWFAAVEPLDNDGFIRCVYCQGHETPDAPLRHDDGCPYKRARELCGMDGDA